MREYIFRGKRLDNGEWVEGIPITTHIGTFIVFEENPHFCGQYGYMEIDELAKVDPEIVGQYTGLKDKNGVKIFEGDILERDNMRGSVSYSDELCRFVFRWKTYDKFRPDFFKKCALADFAGIHLAEIIGNIHDNKDLLKEGGEE